MNAILSPRSIRFLMVIVLALMCLPLLAAPACAADSSSAPCILQANMLQELVGDRTRMIQISLVIVALGCAVMWWYR